MQRAPRHRESKTISHKEPAVFIPFVCFRASVSSSAKKGVIMCDVLSCCVSVFLSPGCGLYKGCSLLTILFCINLANSKRNKHEEGWVPVFSSKIWTLLLLLYYNVSHVIVQIFCSSSGEQTVWDCNRGNVNACVILYCIRKEQKKSSNW